MVYYIYTSDTMKYLGSAFCDTVVVKYETDDFLSLPTPDLLNNLRE